MDRHHHKSRRDHKKSKRHRSRSRSHDSQKRPKSSKDSQSSRSEPETTNLIYFSFCNHKNDLSKVLQGYRDKERIIVDHNDFWLFVNKYESMLKRNNQPILPEPIDAKNSQREAVPKPYDKCYNTNMQLNCSYEDLYHRFSCVFDPAKITRLKFRQFFAILVHYLDFKQKEKFNKLKKLRKSQLSLPVAQYKEEIIEAVRNEQVILIAGDTGCGKSTQVPQYLYQAGFKSIACSQPRRIACVALSKRVAHEMLCEFDTEVGYQIRFERHKTIKTKILFITEGLLLRQLSTEASLSNYDVLVLDEVHERHLHGDFLLGVAKCLLKLRPELKLILMSATINFQLFTDYFAEENVRLIEVPGRLYPIKLHYMPQIQDFNPNEKQSKSSKLNPEPYVQIVQLIDNKYPSTEKGDLLIFMSGINEISTIIDAIKEYSEKNNNWIVLPLHSSLAIADQDKVFDYPPEGIRKCIVSTNIAETSVTIDGIRFVVDSGKVKEMSYDSVSKMQRLKEFWISKASADQRKGRAGRTGPGVCYRLYGEKTFQDFDAYSAAEIHRVPLETALLQMISMGLPNSRLFPFVEPPAGDSIENSIMTLKKYNALTIDEKLTPLGKAIARLPVDISIGKMLLMGCVFEQLQPTLTLAAVLSVQSPFTNRSYRDHECQIAMKDLESDHGDPITILNTYKEWLELKQNADNTKKWCRRRGLEEQRFYEITKLRNQFQDLLNDCGLTEVVNKAELSSSERAIRFGELRQLKEMRRSHKNEAGGNKRKVLSVTEPMDDDDDDNRDKNIMDIRDVEFRLSHDTKKINTLVNSATACNYRDLMTLKIILVSGLYPQIAISDEFNYCKSPGQQFYHTEAKPFACLHPMGVFANNADILQLTEPEIMEKTGLYKSKLPLSSRHQLLCYLSLLETTKPYLMNTLRMPAAQTILLFAHTIDTNATCSRLICDSWLCLDFPMPESGQTLLLKASNLRRSWNKLLSIKLEAMSIKIESSSTESTKHKTSAQFERELWENLAFYMNTDIPYTLKRLLVADLKTMYIGPSTDDILFEPNPFAEDFECVRNGVKGGVYITENICYGCVNESDWSIQMSNEIMTNDWECNKCKIIFNISGMQKLQHLIECKAENEEDKKAADVKLVEQKKQLTGVQLLKLKRNSSKK